MKLAFVSVADAKDKRTWSGTVYNIYTHLSKSNDVFLISPIKKGNILIKTLFSFHSKILRYILKKETLNIYTLRILPKLNGKYIDKCLENKKIDLIISTDSLPFLYTKNKTPLVIITDTTIKLYYKEYCMNKGWTNTFYRAFERNAVAATKKAGMIISSSSETTASLINDYDIKSVATIPFGANLDTDFINYKEKRIQKDKPIHFLFIGREWERKGGEETVLICDELIKKDLEIKLTIVGCKVPETFKRNYILHYEFIDKNIPAENSILKNLLEDAHFLIVLPKAEMYGIVFCEAAAYALPSITRAVGGIKDIVKDNITGISLNRSATIEDYTKRIMQLINDPQSYKEMSKNARSRFEEKLNWDTFTLKLTEQIQEKFKLQ